MNRIMLALAAVAMATFARADTVTLANGNQLEGKATVDGDRVKLQIGDGWVIISGKEVKSIDKADTPQDSYAKKYAALAPGDVPGRLGLAAWCRGRGLADQSAKLLKEVLALEPNNADARRLLGYVQYEGKWVTVDERNLAIGLVQFEGKWYTPEALTDVLTARAAAQEAQAQLEQLNGQGQPQYPAASYGYDYSYPYSPYYSDYPYYYPYLYYGYYPYYYWPPFYYFDRDRFRHGDRHEHERFGDRDDRAVFEHHEGSLGRSWPAWRGTAKPQAPAAPHVSAPPPHVQAAPHVSVQPRYYAPSAPRYYAPPQMSMPQGGGGGGHRR